ncbi:MAG: anti-sigma factor family protein [bacterium]
MKCDLSKEMRLDYYYDELAPTDRDEFETHLAQCTVCKKELLAMSRTSAVLRRWPDEEPNLNLTFIAEKSGTGELRILEWLRMRNWRRTAFGLGLGFAALLFVLSLLNFEANYSDDGFHVKLSLFPRAQQPEPMAQDPLMLPVTRQEFNDWRQNSYQLMQAMIRESETRQQRQNNLLLTEFAKDVDLQRREDLMLVERGLKAFQSFNEDKILHTNQIVNQLLQASYEQRLQPGQLKNK